MSGKVKVKRLSNRVVFAALQATIAFLLILVGLGSAQAQVLYGSDYRHGLRQFRCSGTRDKGQHYQSTDRRSSHRQHK